MANVIGRARGPWERGHEQVLGWRNQHGELEPIGAVHVSGLSGALESIAEMQRGERTSFEDLHITALDSDAEQWLREWATEPVTGRMRDLIIRDQRKGHWFDVSRAWIRNPGTTSGPFIVVVNKVRLLEDEQIPEDED